MNLSAKKGWQETFEYWIRICMYFPTAMIDWWLLKTKDWTRPTGAGHELNDWWFLLKNPQRS